MFYVFALIADTIAMIRFGNSDSSNVRSNLANKFFADTGYVYFRKRRAFELDACRCNEFYGMGETYVEGKLVTLNCCLPTYTFNFQDVNGSKYIFVNRVNQILDKYKGEVRKRNEF